MTGLDLAKKCAEAQNAWANAGLERRLEVLSSAGAALARRRSELREGMYGDGLSTRLANYYGDWIVHTGSPALLARYARDIVRREPSGNGHEILVRRPDGVVLMIAPSGSPTINVSPLFSILLVGNAVIVRAPANDKGLRFIAESILGDALAAHGFRRDTITVLTGRTRAVLADVLPAPEVRTVVFFGNAHAGAAVSQTAHELGKKVVLELEGNGHMAVWHDAELPAALASARHGFDFSSMPCPVPKHFLVHERIHDAFLAGLEACVAECGITIQADHDNGNLTPVPVPGVFEAAFDELAALGEVRTGGHRMGQDGTPDANGPYVAPTIVALEAEVVRGRKLKSFDEEVFFPLIPVVRFRGDDASILDAMTDIVQASPFGLRFSVWSRTAAVLQHFVRHIGDTGLLILNDEHSQCPSYAAPWGGCGRSGGPSGENHFFWEKTSHLQTICAARLDADLRAAVMSALGAPDAGSGEEVQLEFDHGIAFLDLNRPARHNAVDQALSHALARAVARVRERIDEVRCVVVRGRGPSFSSGADLRLLDTLDEPAARQFMMDATTTFRALETLPVPVIAAVHGFCMGGGFELALHCDLVVASEDAVFALPEASLGLLTTAGSIARLSSMVGGAAARDMLFTGRKVSGQEAERMGFVTRSVPPAGLDEAVRELARGLARAPKGGIAAAKRVIFELSAGTHAHSWVAEMAQFSNLVSERGRR